jgi:hypothetical protein
MTEQDPVPGEGNAPQVAALELGCGGGAWRIALRGRFEALKSPLNYEKKILAAA